MLKRVSCFALSMVLLLSIFLQQGVAAGSEIEMQPVTSEEIIEEIHVEIDIPEPITSSLLVDNTVVSDAALIFHKDIAYVSLRHAALALRPDAIISWEKGCAVITAEGLKVSLDPDNNYLVANGRYLYLPEGALHQDGIIRIPARVIAKIFDAAFSYDSVSQNVYLTSGSGAITSGDEYYDKDDLYWLSHIINAESGNQSLIGKIAVGNVVLNRVADPVFPNSIYGVIYQKNQFTPVKNGTIKLTPNAESVVAAKLCLDGAVVLPTALWFNSAKANSWAAKHKVYITTIGAHAFYV